MQASLIFAFLLVASAASASSQPENVSVVGNSPVPVQPVVGEGPQQPSHVVVDGVHHQQVQGASYYSPAGLIQPVGEQGNKPGQFVRNYEQFGQPESASIPPNYKPFGSWGLYIGGNPADGYYTNYYKALGNSVEKQQQGVEQVKPVGGPVSSQTAAFSPFLRQAGGAGVSPFGGDYYPFAYSPSDLSAASRSSVEPAVHSAIHSPGDSSYNLAYADSYATKKIGSAYSQSQVKSVGPSVQQQQQQAKGYYAPAHPFAPVSHGPLFGAVPAYQPSHVVNHQQVVAYPVPVGSQIVGSQPGVEGSFSPYGIHAFTKYAVKPTVVSQQEPSYYYSYPYPAQVVPSSYNKQSQQVAPHYSQAGAYPLSFYGYPLGQLQAQHQQHGVPSSYSSMVPVGGSHVEQPVGVHQQPPAPVEVSPEKVESENKPTVVAQKRA